MSKEDAIEVEGIVTEVMPNTTFKVEISGKDGKFSEVLTHLSGKLRVNYIKILKGDHVKVEISPYDLTKGRITWRSKNPNGFDKNKEAN